MALKARGKDVRFIYWDDFDTFRKVPVNLPNQEMLKTHLREPISRVPDPFGKEESYAAHNIKYFEAQLAKVGISPEFYINLSVTVRECMLKVCERL